MAKRNRVYNFVLFIRNDIGFTNFFNPRNAVLRGTTATERELCQKALSKMLINNIMAVNVRFKS